MKPIVVVYLSRLFYGMGNDSVKEMTEHLQSSDNQYHLFVIPSSDDNTTIDVFPKYVLVESQKDFQQLIEAQNILSQKVSQISNIMSKVLKVSE